MLKLSGMPTINVDEMIESAILSGFNKTDKTIVFLYELLKEWNETMRANFLFFYSGSFKLPLEGFKRYPLKIAKASNIKKLPVGHTCSCQIDLPDYNDKALLTKMMEIAIVEGQQGFFIS